MDNLLMIKCIWLINKHIKVKYEGYMAIVHLIRLLILKSTLNTGMDYQILSSLVHQLTKFNILLNKKLSLIRDSFLALIFIYRILRFLWYISHHIIKSAQGCCCTVSCCGNNLFIWSVCTVTGCEYSWYVCCTFTIDDDFAHFIKVNRTF